MGYQIVYDSASRQDSSDKAKKSSVGIMAGGAFLLFLLLVSTFWPKGREVLQGVLWPGDMETAVQAAEGFVQELRWGEPFMDAAESFCREILKNADLPG